MKAYKWIIILLNLIVLLCFLNFSVFKKESLLAKGKLVLIALAPVDPRSLMQGDYMHLNYEIAQNEQEDNIPKRGYCVVKMDAQGVAQKQRLQEKKTPLYNDEYLIVYTSGKWNLNIGAESFFFQEGEADKYAIAKYGGLMIDQNGNGVLVGLYDENRKKIE
jgi:uncharacterized membrane-anchored protein